jgi:hypothetical protein
VQLLAFMFLVCLGSSNAQAIGLGLYGSYGAGSETWEGVDTKHSFNKDTTRTGVGFVLATAVAKDSLFNYQLNLGYHQYEFKPDGFKLTGYSMAHDFGFGVVRTQDVKLWLGPELKIDYGSGSQSSIDYYNVEFGIGPALGVNLHLGDFVTLALKGGYLFNWGATAKDCKNNSCSDSGFTLSGGEPFINFAIIFRFGDNFSKKQINKDIKEQPAPKDIKEQPTPME